LALIVAPKGSVCAAAFTKSLLKAACIDISSSRLKAKNGHVRAILINSGHANACTGSRGEIDSLLITDALAHRLSLDPNEVLICSTGVIGVPIPVDNVLKNIDLLVKSLNEDGGHAAAQAILTTDLVDKQIAIEANLGGQKVRIGGMAKGSGMISPNMGTMLAYLTCDAFIAGDLWSQIVSRIVDSSFNCVTVDGDTSTNDAFFAFSVGEPINETFVHIIEEGMLQVSKYLAKSIARDGEGANCLMEIQVLGAKTNQDAKKIAKVICNSLLVKTAVHGCDPNWGRILAAAGRAGIDFNLNQVSLWIGPYQLLDKGITLSFDKNLISSYMKERMEGNYMQDDSICICLKVGDEVGQSIYWGCDLSDKYVKINSEYTT